ncbi:MAG: hypothetical protein IJN46_09935 [Lachnospiraceae bacterium]|nr:hypothetical protein [Lachnospiraceae bacterium]
MKRNNPFQAIILAVIMALTGCSAVNPKEETSILDLSSSESFNANEETETVGLTGEIETESGEEKEKLLLTLWCMALQYLEGMGLRDENQENRWRGQYEVEVCLRDFSLKEEMYRMDFAYPKVGKCSYTFWWPEYISDRSIYYDTADKYLQSVYNGESIYSSITEARRESILQIVGQVLNEAYEQADRFLDNVYPYTYHMLWGSVLEMAGRLYQENTGGIVGCFAGQAYLMEFDFQTLTGIFWVCLENETPVHITMKFTNQDCGVYTFQINDTRLVENELSNAWLGLKFDLETSLTTGDLR